jgi:hypothetical protein
VSETRSFAVGPPIELVCAVEIESFEELALVQCDCRPEVTGFQRTVEVFDIARHDFSIQAKRIGPREK